MFTWRVSTRVEIQSGTHIKPGNRAFTWQSGLKSRPGLSRVERPGWKKLIKHVNSLTRVKKACRVLCRILFQKKYTGGRKSCDGLLALDSNPPLVNTRQTSTWAGSTQLSCKHSLKRELKTLSPSRYQSMRMYALCAIRQMWMGSRYDATSEMCRMALLTRQNG